MVWDDGHEHVDLVLSRWGIIVHNAIVIIFCSLVLLNNEHGIRKNCIIRKNKYFYICIKLN